MSKRDQFEVINPRNLLKVGAQHYSKKAWALREELVPCKEKNVTENIQKVKNCYPVLFHAKPVFIYIKVKKVKLVT